MSGVFSSSDVQRLGLQFARVMTRRKSEERLEVDFHKHYGSSSLVLADQWEDLCNYDWTNLEDDYLPLQHKDDLPLSEKEKSEKGLKRFLMGHFWLWAKPKNAAIFSCCDILMAGCDDLGRSATIWDGVRQFGAECDVLRRWDILRPGCDIQKEGATLLKVIRHSVWSRFI